MQEFILLEKLVFNDKKYDEALTLIESSDYSDNDDYKKLKADILFIKNNYEEAAMIYNEVGEYCKVAQCYLLLNQTDLAIEFFKKADKSPAQNWGLFFSELFRGRVNVEPTYLQIRAFLERDLSAFLHLNLVSYVQKIIDISDYLFEINPETNKYIAKAFLFNDYPDYAKEYLDRAFEFTTKDAELYYLLAKYYQVLGQKDKVIDNLKQALRLSENYYPAQIMLNKITEG